MIHNILTIAGTDPSGGAGLQADLKTFSALKVYGASVVTALVAQNTMGVQEVYRIDPKFVAAQCESVFSDVKIDAVKCGMLMDAEVIEAVRKELVKYHPPVLVLDTVMVAKSGDALLAPDAIEALRADMLPLADIITPNLPEAAKLLNCEIAVTEEEMRQQGRALLELGCKAVLMKGGHLNSIDSPDWLIEKNGEQRFTSPRVHTKNTHGTGCTLSSALAAIRPGKRNWEEAVSEAKEYLYRTIRNADLLQVGHGHGPLNHFM